MQVETVLTIKGNNGWSLLACAAFHGIVATFEAILAVIRSRLGTEKVRHRCSTRTPWFIYLAYIDVIRYVRFAFISLKCLFLWPKVSTKQNAYMYLCPQNTLFILREVCLILYFYLRIWPDTYIIHGCVYHGDTWAVNPLMPAWSHCLGSWRGLLQGEVGRFLHDIIEKLLRLTVLFSGSVQDTALSKGLQLLTTLARTVDSLPWSS